MTLAPAVREIVRRADPLVPVSDVRTMLNIIGAETASRSIQLRVLQAFALIASEQQVHVLHRLTGGTFQKIVEHADGEQQAVRTRHMNNAAVGVHHLLERLTLPMLGVSQQPSDVVIQRQGRPHRGTLTPLNPK